MGEESYRKMKKRVKSRGCLKGSLTVEMSFLMPMILFLIMGCILAAFYYHDKLILTGAAYETAVAGSTEAVRRQGDGLETARERLAGENVNYSVNGSKREITVNYEEYVKYPFAGLQWHIQGNAKSKVIRPVSFIGKVRSVRKWKEELMD